MSFIARIQRLLLIAGVLLIAIYAVAHVYGTLMSRAHLRRFRDVSTETAADYNRPTLGESGLKVDFSLWSQQRVAAYERSLAQHVDPPLAVLRISKFHLEVPVLEGTDDLTLDRGVGHILGTVRPGEDGNVGIAGHRDGFFRVLKDVEPGDTIDLLTTLRTEQYVVDQILLVKPSDVSVLETSANRSLTLVTCYPFYFIGSAPQRYIVQASIKRAEGTKVGKVTRTSLPITQD